MVFRTFCLDNFQKILHCQDYVTTKTLNYSYLRSLTRLAWWDRRFSAGCIRNAVVNLGVLLLRPVFRAFAISLLHDPSSRINLSPVSILVLRFSWLHRLAARARSSRSLYCWVSAIFWPGKLFLKCNAASGLREPRLTIFTLSRL